MKKEYFLYAIIIIGLFLRIVWTSDMEWKDDEKLMYNMAHTAVDKGQLPAVGMESGGGIVNPGLSVGVFAVIAEFTKDPVAMNRVVQIINIISILCFLLFIITKIDVKEREVWLYGITLAAISPLAVLFSRKIWAQDLLPILSFIIIFANYHRSKKWGAFIWGLSGALMGQIHMSGFFFAFGLFIFSVFHDHYNKISFKWWFWLAGSFIGSIGLIPWLVFIANHPQETKISFLHIFQFNFYLYWFLDATGLNIYYSLRKDFWSFIKEPFVLGVPTYLVAVAHLTLVAIGAFVLNKLFRNTYKLKPQLKNKNVLKDMFDGMSITNFYLLAILLGLGIFMTLSGTPINQHYLICAFPFTYIFICNILKKNKKIIVTLIIAQLLVTACFLFYIHKNDGAPQGDYKKVYRAQQGVVISK